MTVTTATTSLSPAWNASQLRTLFENAFIATGEMSAWYDSFTSGSIQVGVLEKIYDNTKTYGKTYYVFKFSTGNINLMIAGGWDPVSHAPSGVLYDTYPGSWSSSAANAVGETRLNYKNSVVTTVGSNWWSYYAFGLNSATQFDLTTYTSGVDSNYTWYRFTNGASNQASFMFPGSPAAYIDLDKFYYSGIVSLISTNSPAGPSVGFMMHGASSTRAFPYGLIAAQDTSITFESQMLYLAGNTATYVIPGRSSTSSASNNAYSYPQNSTAFELPVLYSGQMASGETLSYVHTGLFQSIYDATPNMPSDFGIYATLNYNASWTPGDTLVVDPGVIEYEIIGGPNSTGGSGYMAFVGRTV